MLTVTTLVLKLTPLEAARLEFAGTVLGVTREEAAKEAIRLFSRSIVATPEAAPPTKGRKR